MDTHADTCCAGSNWSLLETTGQFCEVSPFLSTYEPVSEIPLARCCTVWTDQSDSSEHLLVGDQMLWFGNQLPNSLINPNQLRAYGLIVNDDPFDHSRHFGIDSEHVFIPFDTTGTVVHFDTRVPTEWEKTHLPVILLTGEDWNPLEEVLRPSLSTREDFEMRIIKSLTTPMREPRWRDMVRLKQHLRRFLWYIVRKGSGVDSYQQCILRQHTGKTLIRERTSARRVVSSRTSVTLK